MDLINILLEACRRLIRAPLRIIARWLNHVSGGRLSPNAVTLTSLAMHLPVTWLVASQKLLLAAILLVIFALFDALDGELARLQNRTSLSGMLLDSTADRMKE